MDRNKKLWQSLELHSELNKELTLYQHLELLVEQTRIERQAFRHEIAELRALLRIHQIEADAIDSGLVRSDRILDRLLRYEQGKSGKLVKKGILIMPYRWRRKFRNALS